MTDTSTPLKISQPQFKAMTSLLASNLSQLFLTDVCRRYFALERWREAGKPLTFHDSLAQGTMPGTIAHNRKELDTETFGSFKRTGRLISPLSSLEPVYSRAAALKALSIGPRTEMELLHLLGIGFQSANIRGLDLISSSPLIDVGDMHDLPYPDRSFDVVISGWAIAYSNRPQRAVDEMIRVCVDGGLIAIGITHDSSFPGGVAEVPQDALDIKGTNFATVADFEKLIGPRLRRVLFQQDPESSPIGPVMIIAKVENRA